MEGKAQKEEVGAVDFDRCISLVERCHMARHTSYQRVSGTPLECELLTPQLSPDLGSSKCDMARPEDDSVSLEPRNNS